METSSRFETDRWQFSGRIVPVEEEFEGWTAGVSLTGVGEDGSRYNDVPIASIQVEHDSVTTNIEDGVAHIVAGPTATAVTFEGESERIGHGDFVVGQVGETEIEIRAELETAESDAS
jgi:hypothetical protein